MKYLPIIMLLLLPCVQGWQNNTYLTVGGYFCTEAELNTACCSDLLAGVERVKNNYYIPPDEDVLIMLEGSYGLPDNNSCTNIGYAVGYLLKKENPRACMDFFDRVDYYCEQYGIVPWSVRKCGGEILGGKLAESIENLASGWKQEDLEMSDMKWKLGDSKDAEPLYLFGGAINDTNTTGDPGSESMGSNFTLPLGIGIMDWVFVFFGLFLSVVLVWKFIYTNGSFKYDHKVAEGYGLLFLYIFIGWFMFIGLYIAVKLML